MRYGVNLTISLLSLGGCADLDCPVGQEKRGDTCYPAQEAAQESDANSASLDAGQADVGANAGCLSTPELCNGLDDDCDGEIDEQMVSYADLDGDGVGGSVAVGGCPRERVVASTGDCDDENPRLFPGAAETCNGGDDNCNGEIDESVRATLYRDADGDGHGDLKEPNSVCIGQSISGYVLSSDDCDDKCKTCSPSNVSEQLCDGLDDDCDGAVDDGVTGGHYLMLDCDGDGQFGSQTKRACLTELPPAECPLGRWAVYLASAFSKDCNDVGGACP